jgi:hypothetical protein
MYFCNRFHDAIEHNTRLTPQYSQEIRRVVSDLLLFQENGFKKPVFKMRDSILRRRQNPVAM